MRGLFGLVLLAGMGLAGFAVYMVNQQLGSQEALLERERQRAAAAVRTVDIYAPSRDLTYGDLLGPDDVQLIKYARDNLPAGVFTTEEEMFPEGLGVPRVVRIPMLVNEPILANKVTEAGAPRGLTALLDPGMRAYPLPDSMTRAFSGELRNSDRIDLYWVGRVGRGESISRLVKSGLEIIAIEEEGDNSRGVVLQVSQGDFADLQLLSSAGTLSLTPVARSEEEGAEEVLIETNIQDVLGIEEVIVEEEPEAVEEERCFITQTRGTERVQVEIECRE